MGEQIIKNNNDYYLGGILKIKNKVKTIKREFNVDNIITLEEISKLSKDNIIQPYNNKISNIQYKNYNNYIN